MKPDIEWLADLVRRTPFYSVDLEAARQLGDTAAIRYATASERWRAEAALALSETTQAVQHEPTSTRRAHRQPSAIDRVALATALMRGPTTE